MLSAALARAGSPAEQERVRYNQIGFDYTRKAVTLFRLYQRLCDSGLPMGIAGYTPDYSKKYPRSEIVELLRQTRRLGQEIEAMLAQYAGTSILQSYPFRRQNEVKRWFQGIEDYWQIYGENSDFGALTALPVEWRFKIDPAEVGDREGWQNPDWDDRGWEIIRTDECWEKQGHPDYNGYAWYRQTIELPEVINTRYTLRLGAVDESCWVFVNGQASGEYLFSLDKDPDAWKKPHYFEITDAVRPGLNVIAIKVYDAAYAGGIWRPASLLQSEARGEERKTVFLEEFQQSEGNYRSQLRQAQLAVIDDISCPDQKSLWLKVEAPYPAGASLTIPGINIAPGKEYLISVTFKSSQVQANVDQTQAWRKNPRLPNARIIFLDKEQNHCLPVKDYTWFGLDFKTQTAGWEQIRKIFKSPANAETLSLTVFLNAAGEYWLDQISIEEL